MATRRRSMEDDYTPVVEAAEVPAKVDYTVPEYLRVLQRIAKLSPGASATLSGAEVNAIREFMSHAK